MALTPDTSVTFWYGCNMARHGEIVRLVTQILDAVGVQAAPAGGPAYCCGSPQEANARIAAGMAARTVEKFNEAGHNKVVTWCPSCHMNMDDLMAPVTEAAFETQHITQLLASRANSLRPLLANPVPARVLLHAHHGFNGRVPVNTDVPNLLGMIPGLTMLDHPLRIPAHMCSAIAPKPGELAQRPPRDPRRHAGNRRRHAGHRVPLLPPRRRHPRACTPDPRRQLDPPARRGRWGCATPTNTRCGAMPRIRARRSALTVSPPPAMSLSSSRSEPELRRPPTLSNGIP